MKIAVAIALGLGTMIGWKRIVVTVGEKIGKTHLTYAQGACAEITAAATIAAADGYGLPVSTTHVLSSGIAGTMAANGSGLQWSTIRNIAHGVGADPAGGDDHLRHAVLRVFPPVLSDTEREGQAPTIQDAQRQGARAVSAGLFLLMRRIIENFRIDDRAMRYSQFVPRLYNYCLSLGFQRERMMPSRAFCSDESQGYPVILIAQHFGTFPFDHGRVGGKVATDRHAPHAHHGEDLIIIQASHVGYDADTKRFGVYQRQRTRGQEFGDNCGKLCAVLHWYQQEYRHACEHICAARFDGEPAVFIDNQSLDKSRPEGRYCNLDRHDRARIAVKTRSRY